MSEESKILDLNAVQAIRDWVKDNFVTKNDLTNLGLVSQLYVTFDEDFIGQTYTITGGDKTYSGIVPESKEVLLLVNTPNTTYTVTCPNDEGTECTCEIQTGSENGRYAGKLECFKAYLHIQAEAGAAVTATIDGYSYTGTAGEDGYCTLTVKRKGSYAVTARSGIKSSDAITAEVSESGATVEAACGELKTKAISWTDGTDEEVAAAIDAARAGTIDLQTDMGWKVGDARAIQMDAWENGTLGTIDAASANIVIASFNDYNSCGCKLQFDFEKILAYSRISTSGVVANGFQNTEMFQVTLPNVVSALPEWLRTRLLSFDTVTAVQTSDADRTETVSGNKLALRSAKEVLGSTDERIEYYKTNSNHVKRVNSYYYWWLRTYDASDDTITFFDCVDFGGTDNDLSYGEASGRSGLSPFGCL